MNQAYNKQLHFKKVTSIKDNRLINTPSFKSLIKEFDDAFAMKEGNDISVSISEDLIKEEKSISVNNNKKQPFLRMKRQKRVKSKYKNY